MIDNLTLKIHDFDQEAFNDIVLNLNECYIFDHPTKQLFDWYNIRIEYNSLQRTVILKNSIHKFYNLVWGNKMADNSTIFTYEQFLKVVDLISFKFRVGPGDIEVQGKGFEFGVNIDTGVKCAFEITSRYLLHRSTRINPFYILEPRIGKPQQNQCFLTQYRIKAYNKGVLTTTSKKNIIRFEIVIGQLRMLNRILLSDRITLETICDKKKWEFLGKFLIETYDKIVKYPILVEDSSLEDIKVYCNYSSYFFRQDVKLKLTPYQFNKLYDAMESIYIRANSSLNNYHNLVRNEMCVQIEKMKNPDQYTSNYTTCNIQCNIPLVNT